MFNYKFKILIFILSVISIDALSQSFKADWKGFKAPINWNVNFVNTSKSYLGKNTQGELVFSNEVDTNLKISYHVFLDFQIDSVFVKKVKILNFIEACVGATKLEAFTCNGFRYFPNLCNNCLTSTVGARMVNAKNNDGKPLNNCELLALEISKFASASKHKF